LRKQGCASGSATGQNVLPEPFCVSRVSSSKTAATARGALHLHLPFAFAPGQRRRSGALTGVKEIRYQ
jgi:hypothetical protein